MAEQLVVTSSTMELKAILNHFSGIVLEHARRIEPVAPVITRKLQNAVSRALQQAELAMEHEPVLAIGEDEEAP